MNFSSHSLPSVSIVLPHRSILPNLISTLRHHFTSLYSTILTTMSSTPPTRRSRRSFFYRVHPHKRKLSILVILIGVIIIGIGGTKLLYRSSAVKGSSDTSQNQLQVAAPKATAVIDREFSFPLVDSTKNKVSDLKYYLEKAEKRNEIIVRGQKAKAVQGRTFLILTMKITNEYSQSIEIDTRDYIRLIIDNNQAEKLAPEIHNDPVEVQAISVKPTRLGFTINDDDRPLTLQIGEINQDKTTITLDFISN